MSNRTSRRRFLLQSGSAVAGTAAAASRVTAAPPSERVRLGLIGAGGRGTEDMLFFIRAGAECVALADPDENQLARAVERIRQEGQTSTPKVYRDYRKLLDHKDIDAVDVGTPDHWHALPTIHACMAGKDVFVAKPVSHNVREGRLMVRAARKHDRRVMVGLQQRIGRHFNDAKRYIDSGALGRIGLCKVWHTVHGPGLGHPKDRPAPAHADYDMWLGPAPKREFNPARFHGTWRFFWDYANGKQGDWGVHLIDIIQWYMNVKGPAAVASSGGKYMIDDITETPDTQCSIFEYPGFLCLWECRTANERPIEGRPQHGIAFHGENGTLVISRYDWEVYPEGKRIADPPRWYQAAGADTGLDMFLAHTKHFLDVVKGRGKPIPDIEDGHYSTTTCQLANIAVKLGRRIEWNVEKESIIGDQEADNLLGRENRKPYELPAL